jgi:hypothetical protein
MKTISTFNLIVTLSIDQTKHFSLTATARIMTLSIKTISIFDIFVT